MTDDPEKARETLLIVDDEEDLRKNLTISLRGQGYHVLAAANAGAAQERLSHSRVDLILLDWMMPGMSGMDLLQLIREDHPPLALPIIMLTALSDPRDVVAALEAGANDYVSKPVNLAVLMARVQTQLDARAAIRTKDEILRIVSHEMKNPLTSVIGSLSFLKDELGSRHDSDTEEMIQLAYQGATRLERLVKNTLDWERLKSGRFELKLAAISLDEIVEASLSELSMYAGKYGVRVTSEVPPTMVLGNSDALIRILTNLVSNAVKFTPRGGNVIVTAAFARHGAARCERDAIVQSVRYDRGAGSGSAEGDEAIIAVIDEGRGIPLNQQSAIFQGFYQVAATDATEKGGHGLGLAITKALVEKLDSRLWFISEPGIGTTFFFPLKIAA